VRTITSLTRFARRRDAAEGLRSIAASPRELRRRLDIEPAAVAYLLYLLLPMWMAVALLDWIHHRRARIEETAGTRESLLHLLMLAESGIPLLLALLLEVTTPVLALMALGFLAHEMTGLYDVTYARRRREVTSTEDMVHSYMEAIPFTCLSLMLCLHWDQLRSAPGGAGRSRVRPKLRPVSRPYLAANLSAFLVTVIAPYTEELLRCRRAERRRAARRSGR